MVQSATVFARYLKRAVADAAAAAAAADATLHRNRPGSATPAHTPRAILIKAASSDAPRDCPHPQNRARDDEYHIVNRH